MHVTANTSFPHHRLDAYHLSLEVAKEARRLADMVPIGHRKVADHLQRSGAAPVMLIAEGANRHSGGTKRQRFSEAGGEVGEAAAAAELLVVIGQIPEAQSRQFFVMADRLAAMLTRLVQRWS